MFRKLPTGPPPDPEELFTGTCAVCKNVVELPRRLASHPQPQRMVAGREPDPFDDLLYAECPTCRTERHSGTRIYLRVKPRE